MLRDTKDKLSPMTIRLHWIVAIMMIGLLASGLYMEQTHSYGLYDWHKSFGLLIVVFVVWRIVWRIMNGWPEHVADYTDIEVLLSKVVHYMLIIGTVLMPISGFLLSVCGGHDVIFFGIELVGDNIDPSNPDEVIPRSELMSEVASTTHDIAGKVIIAAVVLHVVGAIKHHVVDKDSTLKRMLGK